HIAPDFEADTTQGRIRFHEWMGGSWCVLFSHPKDFTPVCTTELGYMAKIKPEVDQSGVKIVGLSVEPDDTTAAWSNDSTDTDGLLPQTGGTPRLSASPARSATRKPSSNTRRAGRRRGPTSASWRSRTEARRAAGAADLPSFGHSSSASVLREMQLSPSGFDC